MRITLISTALMVLAALSGCASKTSTTYESWVFPSIDRVAVRSIGDPLIEQGYSQVGPEIEFSENVTVGKKIIPKGRYPYNTENGTGIWFYKGDYFFYLNKADNRICIDGKDCVKLEFTMGKAPIPGTAQADSLQQTLLYNGKIGNRITLAYRELQNNLARPAFNNSVEYDLSESTIIGYKGARIEIIKATNTEITYRIITGFQK
jgi:hypothetical protein